VVAADDTAAAVVRSDGKILSNVVASQVGWDRGTVGSARMHACVCLYSCSVVSLPEKWVRVRLVATSPHLTY
jgi:hypothetical protein